MRKSLLSLVADAYALDIFLTHDDGRVGRNM
jgi:hypothetical protein